MSKSVAVIGAGIGGLAIAIRLSLKGYQVTIFEKNSYAGGKLNQIEKDGFRFDTGPSLLTLPESVIELFELAKKDYRDYLEFTKLSSTCKYFYSDGTEINAYSEPEKFAEEIAEKTSDKKSDVLMFLDSNKRKYQLTSEIFIFNSLHKIKNYFKKEVINGIINIKDVDVFRTMNQANSTLFHDKKTIQIFNRYATYNGSNPYKAPATLNIISHLEHNEGAYIAKGGMYSIIKSLLDLCNQLSIKIEYNSNIEEIVTKNNKVIGLKIDNKIKEFNTVVNNMDVINTYKKLLPNYKVPNYLTNQEGSSSALIFYWSINRNFPKLDLHNILFSDNYKKEFDYIFTEKEIYKDPTVYIYISSKYNKSDAPDGMENWFVMINTPYNEDQDWDKLIDQSRKNIIKKINSFLKVDIEQNIISEEILDPRSIETKTSSYRGSLYGNSSNSKFSAFLRHPNFSNKIKGLFFCGGSVHPGGGIPLALASAKIVSQMFDKNH
ncbi:MAG: phytoene desaturase [Candidatus Sericytochromatia bacterium]|nr:phytoene desaturase [Candidatus Sericytochromatia bacterium]